MASSIKGDRISVATSASDPGSGATGDVYYSTSENALRYYNGSEWKNVSFVPITATGGTETEYGSYKSHTFTSSGTFSITAGTGEIDVLIVAGGGSGGVDNGGGGGAGGALQYTTLPATPGNYPIVIGAGGAARPGPSDNGPGNLGGNSSAFGYTATRGGVGTGWQTGTPSAPGGSGGGQAGSTTVANPSPAGSGTPGQGNPGGNFVNPSRGGGGGGKGSAGNPGSPSLGNASSLGGSGISNNYRTGSNVTYAAGGTGGFDYATGHRFPGIQSNTNVPKRNNEAGEPAAGANTGHGGHGANHDNETSGAGGSGIVVIRYLTA